MKLEVRQADNNGAVRLDLAGENDHEWQKIREFVVRLNGSPIDKEKGGSNPIFDCSVRVESIGFDDDGSIESIALEGIGIESVTNTGSGGEGGKGEIAPPPEVPK